MMNISSNKNRITKLAMLFSVATIFTILSCAKDETVLTDSEDAIEDEMTETDANDKTTDVSDTNSGKVVFEPNFSLDESRSVVSYVIPQNAYDKFLDGAGDLKLISEKVYEYVKDEYDFIIILSVETVKPEGLFYGRSTLVQNQIEGLGTSTYNSASTYGSAEKLKNIIYMPRTEYIRNGPFLHEIAHTWANKGFIPTTVGGHWGFASTAGQLGGFDELIDQGSNLYLGKLNGNNGFGTFANGGNSIPYGNLELYLMGLIGADELESIQVAVNPEWGQNAGEFTADEIQTHTAQSLIAEHGARVPSVSDSQKEFKALAVIISTEALDQSKVDDIKLDLENFSRASAPDSYWGSTSNFWLATQGKASFKFVVDQENIK